MAIIVTFDGTDLPDVISVTPTSDISRNVITSASGIIGLREQSISVEGLVRAVNVTDLATAQKTLENTFTSKGTGSLSYPGITAFTAALVSWTWEEFLAGSRVARYTAEFEAEIDSPFAETVEIDGTTGSEPKKVFDPIPSVADQFKSRNIDEKADPTKDKKISLAGVLRGTKTEIEAEEDAIKALLTEEFLYSVTIPSGTFTCKVDSFEFGTPQGTDEAGLKTYKIDMSTLPDFALEEFQLNGGSFIIAGVTIEVATSFSHSVTRKGNQIDSETISVGGKNFFTTIGAANSFRDTVDAKVTTKTTFTSGTGKVLAVNSVNWSEPKRDGWFTSGDRRFSIQFTFNLGLDETSTTTISGIHLGVFFTEVNSVSRSVNLDAKGFSVSRTKSVSGKIATIPTVSPGDRVFDENFAFFITSMNFGQFDKSGLQDLSVSGQTLDTAAASEQLFPAFFQGFFLSHVDSQSSSVNYVFDRSTKNFRAQSINESVSGFRIGGNGSVLSLIQTIDQLKGNFIITSVSTGAPEVVNFGGFVQQRFPISISGTLNILTELDLDKDFRQGDIKVETERSIEDATTRYAQVPIPGKGITFKKVGLNPSTETVTVRNKALNEGIFKTMGFPPDPTTSIGGEKIGRSTRESGLTKTVIVKFQRFL